MRLVTAALLCLHLVLQAESADRIVTTNVGLIKGKSKTVNIDNSNKEIYEFLGIPFAEPPVRFMKPTAKANFTETFEAMEYGLPCPQYATGGIYLTIKMPEITSEDCLSLNIHTPNTVGSYPVMIFIYGGGFSVGRSSSYNGEILAAYGEVIVVTINYRVGPFGFLSTGDDQALGNYGLWDQHLAIKWVNNNIDSFGGDVSRITVFGESAGAGSVNLQMLHAGNDGLFQRGIAESGAANTIWYDTPANLMYSAAKQLALKMNCSLPADKNSQELVKCLRSQNFTEIAKQAEGITFSPWVDREFLTAESLASIQWPTTHNNSIRYQNFDFITGVNGYDGHYFMMTIYSRMIDTMKTSPTNVLRTMFRGFVKGFMTPMAPNPNSLEAIVDAAMFLYTNAENPDDLNHNMKQVTDFVTDYFFFVPGYKDVHIHSHMNNKSKTYQYEFNHVFPYMPPGNEYLLGATHASELMYVFGFPSSLNDFFNYTRDQAATQWTTSKQVMDYWTNFAKTGNPNKPKSVLAEWKPFNHDNQDYLYFPMTGNPRGETFLNARRAEFWVHLLPKVIKNSAAVTPETKPCKPTSSSSTIYSNILLCVILVAMVLKATP
ncbi:cholinesterase 2 [Patella vulgata]|uniref:cholinesterase 2 n=1 Tax=Patella vulgata TaxID=6465 RepID=UPI00217F4984|nr:cholinesterase 2 [Patella vulgata]XP_050391500.1 cholinesterase 2 [Patella vulgata]